MTYAKMTSQAATSAGVGGELLPSALRLAQWVRVIMGRRYDDVTDWEVRVSDADDAYNIRCWRGRAWGNATLYDNAMFVAGIGSDAFTDAIVNACRMAYLNAGGGAPLVAFRIGTRSPKRLQQVAP